MEIKCSCNCEIYKNLDAQVAKWKIHYTTVTPTATNHKMTQFSYPKLGFLAPGVDVML